MDIEKAIVDYRKSIYNEYSAKNNTIIGKPISKFYIEQDIQEYKWKNDTEGRINGREYIPNWWKQSSKNILLLLGEPGHGKSSLCKKIISNSVSTSNLNPKNKKFYFNTKIFYFSLSPSNWINPIRNIEEISNIFTIPKDALTKEKYFKDDKFLLEPV